MGIEVGLSDLGPVDAITASHLPVATTLRDTDILIFIFEGDQFMNDFRLARATRTVPRGRRIVIDADGHNRELTNVEHDANHQSSESAALWRRMFAELSDLVLEPSLDENRATRRFLFYGMKPRKEGIRASPDWDLGYIGNNWYRWSDMVWLLQSIEKVRHLIPRIGIRGMWWDHECLSGFPGAGEATSSDPTFLARHNVDCGPAIPFGSVIESMSRACVHPILGRPILGHMKFVTPRMFETFASDAIPAIAPNLEYTIALYGSDARPLILLDNPTEQLVEMVAQPSKYRDLLLHLREELHCKHSYQNRLADLLQLAGQSTAS